MRVLGRVAAQCGENPHHRRGQGSSALFISRGLAGPKTILNRNCRKGMMLIFISPPVICSDGSGKVMRSYVRSHDTKLLENCYSEKEAKSWVP